MIRGAIIVVLLAANTFFWGIPVTLLGLVRVIAPTRESRRRVRVAMGGLGDRWAGANNRLFDAMVPAEWDISGFDSLQRDGHYLIISNHVSWLDIFVLFRAFHRRVAFMRFFLKRELMWFPIVGQACWAMDFPFMRRYAPEYLARHPEKRGLDLEATRRTCRRYRHIPFAILNFLEGTRFSEEKRAEQESPYRNLLRPRIGGTAFVLASLSEHLDAIVDVTIVYPQRDVSMWDFLTGRVRRIIVRARVIDIPAEFRTDAITQPGVERDHFRSWIDGLWSEKDALVDECRTVVHSYHGRTVRD